jgi:hypothetical protein
LESKITQKGGTQLPDRDCYHVYDEDAEIPKIVITDARGNKRELSDTFNLEEVA